MNLYCERLEIEPPRLETVLEEHPNVKLFQLVIITLLEQGGPMHPDALAERLEEAGAYAPSGDMLLSVKKAWHGLAPVRADPDGRYALDLDAWQLRSLVHRLLTPSRPPAAITQRPPDVVELPGDDVPLRPDEVSAALKDRILYGGGPLSPLRQAAALLDVAGRPAALADVEGALRELTSRRSPITEADARRWPGDLVRFNDGTLTLNPSSESLGPMRRAVRKLAEPELRRRAQAERARLSTAAAEVVHRERAAREALTAAGLRRVLVHALPSATDIVMLSVVDLATREIHSFMAHELSDAAGEIAQADIAVGLHIRQLLHTLGVDGERMRLVDLGPPQKSMRLNKSGRTLKITPELLITASTGISQPLADPAKVADYVERGDMTRLRRRLESDVKALAAFYGHGLLHRSVRLRWGFLDERLGVDWHAPGDPSVYELFRTALETGALLEVVVGNAPGWEDPWSRARLVRVLAVDMWTFTVQAIGEQLELDRREIQAVRIVP